MAAAFAILWFLDGDARTVPLVVGMPLGEAVAEVVAAGLEASTVVVEAPEDTAAGTILEQDPPAGTEADAGSEVLLGVAFSNLVEVLDVVGLRMEDATAELAGAGLAATTERVPAGGRAPGTVLAQDPEPGTEVAAGSRVRLDVAGDGGDEGGEEGDGDDGGDGAGDGGDRGGDRDDEGGNGGRRNIVAWLLDLGPSAPSGPSQVRAYELLRTGDCTELIRRLDTREGDAINLGAASERLYRGAAAACLAAFHDQPARWAEAYDALGVMDPADPGVVCFDAATHLLLERLVAGHRENPDGEFERATGGPSTVAPPCPTLTRLDPDSGPPGTAVRITGRHLDRVIEVELLPGGEACPPDPNGRRRGARLEFTRDGGDIVATLADAVPGSACVVLVAAPSGWGADGARFTIVEEPGEDEEPREGEESREDEETGEDEASGDGEEPGEDGEPGEPEERSSPPEESAARGAWAALAQPGR